MKGKEILKHKILAKAIPFFLVGILRLLACFVRFKFKASPKSLEAFKTNQPFMLAFWHGELLFQPFIFKKLLSDKKVYVLISKHFDGEIISNAVGYFGIQSLRGSTSKGGMQVLYRAIHKTRQNEHIAITPDGPRGPYHSIADGIVFLAQKTQTPIIISRILYHNAWEFKSWDKFKIPKPFSIVEFILKDPLMLDAQTLETAKETLRQIMEEDK